MDVTALLNESSSAVDQQRRGIETLRLPTRSRTPWDAGGYSLPLNTAALKITSPEVDHQDAFHLGEDDTTTVIPFTSAMPMSPIHKFTDSRSSLSSFASSSLHSANHSRYSSISTLNSPRALTSNLPDPMLSPNPPLQSVEMSYFRSRDEEEARMRFHQDHSPTKSLDTLAQIAEDYQTGESTSPRATISEGGNERRFQSQQPEARPNRFTPRHSRSISNGGSASSSTPNAEVWQSIEGDLQEARASKAMSVEVGSRPQRNDIDRPSSPSDTLLIKRTTIPSLHLNTRDQHLQLPYLAEQHHSAKSHKRATSAPNFAAMDINRVHPTPMAHEPTPPTSNHPDHASPQAPFEQSPPESPPTAAAAVITEPVCMYIDDCDTDSPQRKAISHIFGRNKMCTRMIPEHLWVHLCRKHYQRCRYRDQDKWAKAQCDLVQIQIRRIHEWSMTNQMNGSGIRLQNWTLTMRKREKMRRMKLAQDVGAMKRKRGASSQDDDDIGDRDESGYPSTTTKVPDWLVDHCDKEFSTAGILVVFNRLHQDIIDGRVGPHFPDLELLPNLLTPEGMEKKAKPAAKATPRKTHQRSQSLQTPSTHESPFRDSATKRRRPNEELSFERGLQPAMRQSVRRPAYPSINEHEVSDAILPRPMFYPESLLAPTAQRMGGQSMAAHLEASDYRSGRPMHSRSHSDTSSYSNGHMHSSPEYQMGVHYNHMAGASNGRFEMGQQARMVRVAPSPEYAHGGQMGGRDFVMAQRQSPMMMGQHESMMVGREMAAIGHNRHNSSPAQRSQYIPPQQHHSSPGSYNSPHIRETQGTRDLYSARR